MDVSYLQSPSSTDPLAPWIRSLKKALDDLKSRHKAVSDIAQLASECIEVFRGSDRYRNDIRFLKIWFIRISCCEDFGRIFDEMLKLKICVGHSLLYLWYAAFLESREKLCDAQMVYQMGILRNAEPRQSLKKAHALFLDRMAHHISEEEESKLIEDVHINPWSSSTIKELLKMTNAQMVNYEGFHSSSKACPANMPSSSIQNYSKKKILEIGGKKYQIKGCAGHGGFAQVYKAFDNSYPDNIVALKIQKPPFPWEFYMYRQLDRRISPEERISFGHAYRVHLYSDCSILVCDYLANGTLQDAINANFVIGKSMEEVLCMYYTIEMLYMLENLHSVDIVHGDFKPDNLLIRYARDDLVEDEFSGRKGAWRDQGLCLVDWGRGIDLRFFPENTEFTGDCRTSGFRCVQMQQNKLWKFQVDTYGLCVIVHLMLHNTYMEIQEKPSFDGASIYLPKSSLKRYWNVDLWRNLFTKLLNSKSGNDVELLRNVRESFQNYMCSSPQLIRKLKELLLKQRASLCSS